MMKTPEQLKGAIRNLAKKKGIHAQEVLQIFMIYIFCIGCIGKMQTGTF